MSRNVSPAFQTAVTSDVTTPGYLVEISFSNIFAICSRTDVSFGGSSFIEYGFTINGLSPTIDTSSIEATIDINDPDRTVTSLVLNEGIEERRIRVWMYYGDVARYSSIDLNNPVLLFDGFGYKCEINPNSGIVSITVIPSSQLMSNTPRVRICKENGFLWLPADGQEFEFGGEKWRAESE